MFRFRTLPGGQFSYRPSNLVLALAKHLERFSGSYIVVSPYGTLVYEPHFSAAYLVREAHPVSGLWRYVDNKMQFVSRVDASPLDSDFGSRVVCRASRTGFYRGDTVLPVLRGDEFGVNDKSWYVTIPGEMFPYRGVIQHDQLAEFVRSYNDAYYAMPAGAVLKRNASMDILEFDAGGTSVSLVSRHGVFVVRPLNAISAQLEALYNIRSSLRVRTQGQLSSGSKYYTSDGYERVQHLIPNFRLGLLATSVRDPFIRTLQTGRGPEKFLRIIQAVTDHRSLDVEFEVLGVYKSLDGSTGRTVWYADNPTYQPKRSSYDFAKLMRVYHLYTDTRGVNQSSKMTALLASIPGSVLYSCPLELSDWPFSSSFEVTDDGRAVLIREPPRVMFYRLEIQNILLDTGRDDVRLVLPAEAVEDLAAYPIILSSMGRSAAWALPHRQEV